MVWLPLELAWVRYPLQPVVNLDQHAIHRSQANSQIDMHEGRTHYSIRCLSRRIPRIISKETNQILFVAKSGGTTEVAGSCFVGWIVNHPRRTL
jgi:hypothetical protein